MSIITHETAADSNIFADLGVEDAENLRIRSLLMIEITHFIEEEELTQTAAAELMQTSQPYISDIVNGRIERFTIDRLVTMLSAVGHSVTIKVERAA